MLLRRVVQLRTTFSISPAPPVSVVFLRSRPLSTDSNNDSHEDFFKYTSGRWIHNEAQELAKRYHRFNVDALKRAAAEAGGANSVLAMRKLVEGRFNKAFLMTLDNGKEVVARLPTSSAGPSHRVTASEVATIDFVRSRLEIPAPRVLAWSSDTSTNPVESDYIIMEKAEGVELDEVWNGLTQDLKRGVVSELVRIEKLYMKKMRGGYGSLYYRSDAEADKTRDLYVDGVRDEKFVLGPATPTSYWRDGKADMDSIDRGPWDSTLSYLLTLGKRERDWIEKHAVVNEYPGPFDPPTSRQTPEAHVALLNKFITVAPHLVPSNPDFIQPALCHRDLNSGNIFISKESLAAGEIKITSIIDWQHACVMPLYAAARIPAFLQIGDSTKLPFDPLADMLDLASLSQEHRQAVENFIERTQLEAFYFEKTYSTNPIYYEASNFPTRGLIGAPAMFAGITWPKHFISFRESLFRLIEKWEDLRTGVPCPIDFSEEEWKAREFDRQEWQTYEQFMMGTDAMIGASEGWVSNGHYESAIAKNKAYMDAYIAELKKEVPEEASMADTVVPTFWIYRPWET